MLLAPAALSAAADSGADASVVVRKDSAFVEKHRFLPTAKRIDRRIDRNKFAYKGEVALGITASYGTISSDDTDMMLILDNINLDGTIAQVNPFMVGLRLGYRHIGMGLGNLEVDLGSQNDLDISLDNMDYSGNAYSFGLFHRSYTGIDPKGSFGLFAELELSGMIGRSDFSYLSGDTPKSTHSKSFKMNISFNPEDRPDRPGRQNRQPHGVENAFSAQPCQYQRGYDRSFVEQKERVTMKRLILFGALCLPAFFAGCIHNDLPYPVVTINIEAIEAEGLDGAAQINAAQQTVILPLLETTDIRNVHITSVTLTEGGQSSVAFPGTFDLRTPLYTTLSLYQEYGWSIAATQTIERYFRVKKQVGAAEIDPANRTATAYVSRSTDLQNVPVKELKLGPAGITTYSPEIEGTTSFETVRLVDVTAHGRTEQWRLRVVPTDVTVRITQCDAWARIAWLAADGLSDTEMGFVYRRKGDTEWLAVPDVEIEGGTFRAKLAGLDPETTYELRAFSDTDSCDMREFTTEAAPQLPNAGFETWSTDRSDILYPYAADAPLAEQFWGSGNPGSMTLKKLVTTNEKDPRPGSEGQYCAQLKSQYVAFLGVGKFAAGNLFSGHYAETKGTDGIVNFSQPFTSRPVALHGWVKYNRGKMDYIKSSPVGMSFAKGDPDEGIIYMALGRWTAAEYGGTEQSPVQVYTRDTKTFFDPEGKDVIAYGEVVFTTSVDEWREFTVKLDYTATDVVPTHLMIVCSASRYGDYFTGSSDSVMWVDDFELVYE